MNGPIGEQSKIRAEHRERSAFVYVRQSSLRQVRNHLESQRRQYAFADQAVEFGWCRDRVVVVDEDQGKSGAIPQARASFARLVGAVARGEVGLVMSLELSRLSRNDADWNHLVYLCRWTGALIADEHGVYDPSSGADRMVLGIRGQVSEMERDSLVHRMVEARWNKARRGEAFTIPPAGYELDEIGQWGLTSDEAVQTALRRVFSKFDELGAARQVYLWWRDEGLPFPVRRIQLRAHPIVWVPVSYRLVYQALRHPIYAGAFVFGRSHTTRALDAETQRITLDARRRHDLIAGRRANAYSLSDSDRQLESPTCGRQLHREAAPAKLGGGAWRIHGLREKFVGAGRAAKGSGRAPLLSPGPRTIVVRLDDCEGPCSTSSSQTTTP